MHAPHTVGACKLESACTGAGLYRRWVPAPEMPRARFLRLRMLDRIKTAHPYEDFITIGPNKSKDMRMGQTNPLARTVTFMRMGYQISLKN